MNVALCVCAWIEPIPTATRVVVVIERREHQKPSNTGHLVQWLLPESEVIVRESGGTPIETGPGRRPYLLFPREEAKSLEGGLGDGQPVTLVLPDAPWRQARRMARRWPELAGLPALSLPPGRPSTFELRKSRQGPAACGTLEAVARALGILESQYVEDRLLAVHDQVVERGLRARGRLPRAERRPRE